MNTETEQAERHAAIDAAIAALGLSVTAEFVPFSKSRNAAPKAKGEKPWLSLNWRVTLAKDSRPILRTDYSAGSGHCPASKKPLKAGGYLQHEAVKWECENGKPARIMPGSERLTAAHPATILPDTRAVIASLVLDASVLDSAGFEEWAEDYGYDTDSRSAERDYRACLETALKLRNALGEAGLASLREAFQDY